MIYYCPECDRCWYIMSQNEAQIKWKWLGTLVLIDKRETITRFCPHHTKNTESAGVSA
jgi:hypothetical protein